MTESFVNWTMENMKPLMGLVALGFAVVLLSIWQRGNGDK